MNIPLPSYLLYSPLVDSCDIYAPNSHSIDFSRMCGNRSAMKGACFFSTTLVFLQVRYKPYSPPTIPAPVSLARASLLPASVQMTDHHSPVLLHLD